ncbi:peptidoglycan DD-metalloendopeptidase family protein [Halomonas sp. TRM85114]|uniref:peptidoglycan DD-metalloendopeptidase family protein n=1 Tax=Halomonas jincaotanensis TaxID=2810616 RepID=UPI001BD2610A|nr:peptidoglycan DD-metalloendopeptidase family protein [Halomonas jincaotanensis]MBS9402882.1 peptidoglycan DD-metalloendopeptidase family protein [Halomonas jincaotanensis]
MRKVLLISSLSLVLAGCATEQAREPSVQVRDLSASRADSSSSDYTVQAGDTLYGIAWRHNMDHRDLAQRNSIGPPYRIEPGQRLVLNGDGGQAQASSGADDEAGSEQRGVVATGLGTADESDGDVDWLRPDDDAIERNRRLTARPLEDAVGDPDAEGLSETAMLGAAAVSGSKDGPGPVYNFESPGADGSLSERDVAERESLEAERVASEATRETESQQVAMSEADDAVQEEPASETQEDPTNTAASREEPAPRQADAGTSVAGEPASEQQSGRTYTPVDEVPWQWPVEGEVVGQFGDGGSITAGIDIAGQKGQPVKAAGPGIVVYAGSGVRGYGNLILLKHNDQFLSAYAHNDSLMVKENDVVEAGETIATMGNSDAEDTRLHFEVRKDGQPENPLDFLPSR